jgi:hypothetical protein
MKPNYSHLDVSMLNWGQPNVRHRNHGRHGNYQGAGVALVPSGEELKRSSLVSQPVSTGVSNKSNSV